VITRRLYLLLPLLFVALPSLVSLPGPRATAQPSSVNLTVTGIEVTQGIQLPDNSVSLIANRPTVARVTIGVQNSNDLVPNVTARLKAKDTSGAEIPGTAVLLNDGEAISAPPQPDPAQVNDTLNFLLPSTWIEKPALTLSAEVNPDRRVAESDFNDNVSADKSVTFLSVPALEIVLVPIAYQPDPAGPVYRPDLGSNNAGLGNLRRILPVGEVKTTVHAEYLFQIDLLSQSDGWDKLLEEIRDIRNRELPGDNSFMPIYYAVVPKEAIPTDGGAFTAGIGYVGNPQDNSFTAASAGIVTSDGTAAHEVGHNFGRDHAPCGVGNDSDLGYPYEGAEIGNVGIEIVNSQLKLHPANEKDIMSYCEPQWISDYTYSAMLSVLTSKPTQPQLQQAEQQGLLIAGEIAKDGQSGELDYVEPLSTTTTVAQPGTGSYRVELRDSGGGLLFSYAFTPLEAHAQLLETTSFDFNFVAPDFTDLGSIELWNGNTKLDTLVAASAAPNLSASLVSVPGDPNALGVEWQASSDDGQPTFVSLYYSSDNGESWDVIALDEAATASFAIDRSILPGSANGLIGVVANNTTREREVIIEIGPVAEKAPLAVIFDDTVIQLEAGEPLLLEGAAIDLEQESVAEAELSWTDLDGALLARGDTLFIPDGLPVGTYPITLTASSSSGATSQDTVTVVVSASTGEREVIFLPGVIK
jgi:hypothetical protein